MKTIQKDLFFSGFYSETSILCKFTIIFTFIQFLKILKAFYSTFAGIFVAKLFGT